MFPKPNMRFCSSYWDHYKVDGDLTIRQETLVGGKKKIVVGMTYRLSRVKNRGT